MEHHRLTFFLVFFLFSFSLLSSSCILADTPLPHCHPNDYKVLMQIKQSLNNPDYLFPWLPNTDCCTWPLLSCDSNTSRVNQLTITSAPLSGQIPPMVGNLPYLEILAFENLPKITGPIPRSITKLKNLRILRLTQLNLAGPLPSFLSELTNLQYLGLNDNKFTGSIPPSFSKFTKLGALSLHRNRLSGSIPKSFGYFTGSVPDLYLSHNQLSGSIPKSLGNMDFGVIDLSNNKLVGDASMLFRPNGSTLIMDLSRNKLEFDFSKIKFSKTLVSLDLHGNRIYGSIPKEMNELEKLDYLRLSYNSLCGDIPNGQVFQKFDAFDFMHNKCLCGQPLRPCK